MLNFCWVSIFFDIIIAYTSWTLAQTPINHIIFWKTVTRTFRCIYVNCCNRIRLQIYKNTLFQQLRTKLRKKTWKQDKWPYFSSSTFSSLTVCNIHFYIWKWWKFIFMWSSILVYKIPQFWQKLPIPTVHDTFLERRHPEVTKNPNYVLSPKGSQKKVSTHGLLI